MIRINKPKLEYRLRTLNLKSNLILIDYLNQYPLYSSKYLDYQDWKLVVQLFQESRKTFYGRLKVKDHLNYVFISKSKMNNMRTQYPWELLNNFYYLEK